MKYILSLKINWILKFLILAILIGGCAPALHKPLDPALRTGQKYDMKVLSKIPKEKISINITQKQYTSGGGGLLWILVDAGINKVRESRAEKRIVPLFEATATVNFSTQYWTALEKALLETTWLKIKHLDKRSLDYTEEEMEKIKPPFLVLQTSYALSSNSQILFVQTNAKLYLKDLEEPDYFGVYTYNSSKVGKNDEDDEEAIALWAANNAELYRSVLAEGIEQNIHMLQLDLLGNISSPKIDSDQKTSMFFYEPFMDVMFKIKGNILTNAKDRILMRIENGNLVSVPSGF